MDNGGEWEVAKFWVNAEGKDYRACWWMGSERKGVKDTSSFIYLTNWQDGIDKVKMEKLIGEAGMGKTECSVLDVLSLGCFLVGLVGMSTLLVDVVDWSWDGVLVQIKGIN